jgi:hypothetical protein
MSVSDLETFPDIDPLLANDKLIILVRTVEGAEDILEELVRN